MKKFLIGLFALLTVVASVVFSVLFANETSVSGIAPTHNTDGSELTDLAEIRIYREVVAYGAECSGNYALLVTLDDVTPGQPFSYVDGGQLGNARYCYVATAVDERGNESDRSNVAFKDVDGIAPRAPTGLSAG